MQIQINAGNGIHSGENLVRRAEEEISAALDRFGDQVTRAEVHLTDQNARKGGPDDKQCVLEVRVAGQQPVVVTHRADTVEEAFTGAAQSMASLLDSRLGKLRHTKGGESIRHLPAE